MSSKRRSEKRCVIGDRVRGQRDRDRERERGDLKEEVQFIRDLEGRS